MLDKLERRFGRWAVPNVAVFIVFTQLTVYAMILVGAVAYDALSFQATAILREGEYWRLFAFVIAPPFVAVTPFSALFLAFFWYVFHMMSGALEGVWGAFRLNLYLLLAVIFSLVAGFVGYFIAPGNIAEISPGFLYASVFFAFATLNPNFEFLLFFVLPVKVKWLAWIAAALLVLSVLTAGSISEVLVVIAPVLNYLLFFGADLRQILLSRGRRKKFEAQKLAASEEAFHTCSVCGATDRTAPDRGFRYRQVDGEAVCTCNVCRDGDAA